MTSRWLGWTGSLVLIVAAMAIGCGRADDSATRTELQRLRSGTLDVVVLSPQKSLQHGKDTLFIEFRSASGGSLVDVGNVRFTASMPMAGMAPMFGNMEVQRTGVPGRYSVGSDLGMAGSWRMNIEWGDSATRGSVSFTGTAQ